LTTTVPKPLLPIAGQAFLERQLTWLAGHGIEDVVLSLGYLPDAFLEHFPDGEFEGVGIRYAVEPSPLGTAGAIRFAATSAGIHERFLVCNGDVLTTLDVRRLVQLHDDRDAEATLHLTQVEDSSAFGVVPTDADGAVQAFVEKPPVGSAPTDWINAGTYVLEPSVLARIPDGAAVSVERETFPQILAERGRLFALGTDDYWLDIGTPEKYLQAQSDTVRGAVGLPPLRGARQVSAGIWAEATFELAPDAVLAGPVLLGAESVVATRARVENSTLGNGTVVGADAVVTGAVLLDGARVEHGARVDRSIIGTDALVDALASVVEGSIVGPGARVEAGSSVQGARVELSAAAG
jgi:NDP-sugar pyrophosphorylase family protein